MRCVAAVVVIDYFEVFKEEEVLLTSLEGMIRFW